jgi:hypothetical protein
MHSPRPFLKIKKKIVVWEGSRTSSGLGILGMLITSLHSLKWELLVKY